MKLSEYIKSRQSVIADKIAAERIGGNDFKLHCELSAEAELRALECFLSSADYTHETAAPPSVVEVKTKIEVGQIWEIIKEGFHTSGQHNIFHFPVVLPVGKKIEIRYPYEWHFRTEENIYFHAVPDMIIEKCTLVGVILPEVRMRNLANLDEILRLNLYNEIKQK